jgi:putative hydrolase of the HAD superfamily
MRKPRAVLFDLWGTLIRSDTFDPAKGNAAVLSLAENREEVKLQKVQELGERIVSALQPWEEESRLEFTEQSLLKILRDSFGLRFTHSLAELEWVFWDASMTLSLTDGIAEALAELDKLGISKGVVSNSSFMSTTIERELTRCGLGGRFPVVVSSADYGVRKPDPIIFHVALKRLGAEPSESWFVGDNITYDVKGPLEAGIFPILYNGGGPGPGETTEYPAISRWEELIALIEGAYPE